MKPYEISPAGLDTNVGATTQYWTGAVSADSAAEPFVQEFEGSFHMRDKKTEDPTNILYMLYPNGESGQYPYPAEHEPYSRRIRRVDNPIPAGATSTGPGTPANSTEKGARAPNRRGAPTSLPPSKPKRAYVRRTKAADATTPNRGESSSSSSVAVPSTSQTQKSQRTITIRRNRLPAQDGCVDPACLTGPSSC